MAQFHRAQGEVELKCDADKFFDLWAHKIYHVAKICPDKIQKTVLNEGEWNKVGALITGYYVINETGESSSLKSRVKEIDEKKRYTRYTYHEGLIMENYYNSFEAKMEVTKNGNANNGCIVKWSFEYEKKNKDAPDANVYIHFMLSMAKDVDAHLCMP
ncbi:unnamed protein product [Amaranthus hypochondriacus]